MALPPRRQLNHVESKTSNRVSRISEPEVACFAHLTSFAMPGMRAPRSLPGGAGPGGRCLVTAALTAKEKQELDSDIRKLEERESWCACWSPSAQMTLISRRQTGCNNRTGFPSGPHQNGHRVQVTVRLL